MAIDPPVFSTTPVVVDPDSKGKPSTLELTVTGLEGVAGDTNVVAGLFSNGNLLGRTEAASKGGAKGVAFARQLQVTNATEASVSVYTVQEGATVAKETFVGSANISFTGKEDGVSFALLDNSGKATGSSVRLDQAGTKKDKFAGAGAAETKEQEPLPEGPLFEEDGDTSASNYRSYDNDSVHGFACPSLEKLALVNAEAGHPAMKAGQPVLLVFWAQFSKAGYKFMPLYSKLNRRYGDKCPVIGVSVDPEIGSPKKWVEDPGKKYSTKFETLFTIAWDEKQALKEAFSAGLRDTVSLPHAFLIDKDGKCVWHQDHSQIGATAPTFMNLMETQVKSLLDTGKVTSVGAKEVDSDEDSDEGDEGDAMDVGDFDDIF